MRQCPGRLAEAAGGSAGPTAPSPAVSQHPQPPRGETSPPERRGLRLVRETLAFLSGRNKNVQFNPAVARPCCGGRAAPPAVAAPAPAPGRTWRRRRGRPLPSVPLWRRACAAASIKARRGACGGLSLSAGAAAGSMAPVCGQPRRGPGRREAGGGTRQAAPGGGERAPFPPKRASLRAGLRGALAGRARGLQRAPLSRRCRPGPALGARRRGSGLRPMGPSRW